MTHHVTSAVLCTPSRAALLTGEHIFGRDSFTEDSLGRYGIRMGMTGLEDTPPVLIYAAGRAGLPANETSFARIAKDSGYRTAAVGKVKYKSWGRDKTTSSFPVASWSQ